MEFADRVPIQDCALLCALISSGLPDPQLDRLPSRPLHPRKLNERSALCRLLENFLRLVALAVHHHRPGDAGGLVGQCDRSKFGRFARQQPSNPLAIAGWSITGMAPPQPRRR